MNKPNNKRSRDTDEAIIRAAFQCMVMRGKPVSKITVREICETAGINRSTFYAHYMDVYDLFDKVEIHMAEMCQERIRNAFILGRGFQMAVEGVFQFVEEYKEFYLLYLHEMSQASHLIEMMNAPFQEEIKKIREADMGYGVPGEAAYHFTFLTAGMTSLLAAWLLGNCKETPHELYEILLREYGPNSLLNTWSGGQVFPE